MGWFILIISIGILYFVYSSRVSKSDARYSVYISGRICPHSTNLLRDKADVIVKQMGKMDILAWKEKE